MLRKERSLCKTELFTAILNATYGELLVNAKRMTYNSYNIIQKKTDIIYYSDLPDINISGVYHKQVEKIYISREPEKAKKHLADLVCLTMRQICSHL